MAIQRYYTLKELETLLHVSHTNLLFWVNDGSLPAIKFNGKGKWRVSEEDFKAFLAKGYTIKGSNTVSADQGEEEE